MLSDIMTDKIDYLEKLVLDRTGCYITINHVAGKFIANLDGVYSADKLRLIANELDKLNKTDDFEGILKNYYDCKDVIQGDEHG